MITGECIHCRKIAYLTEEDTCVECKITQEEMAYDRSFDNLIALEIDRERESGGAQ